MYHLKRPVVRTAGLCYLFPMNKHGLATHDYFNLELRHHHAANILFIFVVLLLFGCKFNQFIRNCKHFPCFFLLLLLFSYFCNAADFYSKPLGDQRLCILTFFLIPNHHYSTALYLTILWRLTPYYI